MSESDNSSTPDSPVSICTGIEYIDNILKEKKEGTCTELSLENKAIIKPGVPSLMLTILNYRQLRLAFNSYFTNLISLKMDYQIISGTILPHFIQCLKECENLEVLSMFRIFLLYDI